MKIFTIGYEGTTVPEFIAALNEGGVERVIDVRALPLSRRGRFRARWTHASPRPAATDSPIRGP